MLNVAKDQYGIPSPRRVSGSFRNLKSGPYPNVPLEFSQRPLQESVFVQKGPQGIYRGTLYFVSAIFDSWMDVYRSEKLGMFTSLEECEKNKKEKEEKKEDDNEDEDEEKIIPSIPKLLPTSLPPTK